MRTQDIINIALSLKSCILYSKESYGILNVTDEHLNYMIDNIIDNADSWDEGKLNRWIGFIQGVVVSTGYSTIDKEKDRVRKILK